MDLEFEKAKYKGQNMKWRTALVTLPVVMALALSACGEKKQEQGMPTAQVGYITAQATTVGLTRQLPGRLEASRVADVRARVAGVVLSRKFEEGSDVKAGQLLFQIDDAPYRANLQSARAQYAQASASLLQTKAQAERYKPLVAANAVSKQDYDNAIAAQRASEANIAAANASIKTAQINLGYAAVTSPISGRIGRALVTEGALVGQGNVTELAKVQQIDPMYVNFTQAATDTIALQRAIALGEYDAVNKDGSIPITVVLDDGTVYEHEGKLLFTDLNVDEATGKVSLRATLPNPNKILLPGLYVQVHIEQVKARDSYLIPQSAVTRGERSSTVYIVNSENIVEVRQVTLNGTSGQNWVVSSGLQDGDRVMVDGVQKWGMAIQGYKQMLAAKGERVEGLPPLKVTAVAIDASTDAVTETTEKDTAEEGLAETEEETNAKNTAE